MPRIWWGLLTAVGWSVVVGAHVCSFYFWAGLSLNYDYIIFRYFQKSAVQVMLHRTVTFPLLVLAARSCRCFDMLLVDRCPHVITVEQQPRWSKLGGARDNDDPQAGDDADDGRRALKSE